VHVLFETAQFLAILDPRLEEDIKQFKLDESMKLFAKALDERVAKHARRSRADLRLTKKEGNNAR
jgi:hypothetical protein